MTGIRDIPSILLVFVLLPGCAGGAQRAGSPSPQAWQRVAENPLVVGESLPILGDMAAIYEDGIFKMWYAHGYLVGGTPRVRTEYAISQDGLHWEWQCVSLDVGAENAWDRTTAETPFVLRDDAETDAARRYKMWYSGSNDALEGGDYGIGLAFSPDGRVFTKISARESPLGEKGRVMRAGRADGDVQALADPTVIRKDGIYHMWYTTGMVDAPEVVIGYATSPDGVHWTKYSGNPVLRPNRKWEKGRSWIVSSCVQPTVLYENGEYRMWYASFLELGSEKHLTAGFGYAVAKDGIHWMKPYDAPVFVTHHGHGEEVGLMTGPVVLRCGAEYWLFYPGCRKLDPYTTVINAARWSP